MVNLLQQYLGICLLGEDSIVDQDSQQMIKAGDLRVKTYMPHFVARDYFNIDAKDNLWYVLVDFVNKYELAASISRDGGRYCGVIF